MFSDVKRICTRMSPDKLIGQIFLTSQKQPSLDGSSKTNKVPNASWFGADLEKIGSLALSSSRRLWQVLYT